MHELYFAFEYFGKFVEFLAKGLPLCISLEGLHEIVLQMIPGEGLLVDVVELDGALYRIKRLLVLLLIVEHNCLLVHCLGDVPRKAHNQINICLVHLHEDLLHVVGSIFALLRSKH